MNITSKAWNVEIGGKDFYLEKEVVIEVKLFNNSVVRGKLRTVSDNGIALTSLGDGLPLYVFSDDIKAFDVAPMEYQEVK